MIEAKRQRPGREDSLRDWLLTAGLSSQRADEILLVFEQHGVDSVADVSLFEQQPEFDQLITASLVRAKIRAAAKIPPPEKLTVADVPGEDAEVWYRGSQDQLRLILGYAVFTEGCNKCSVARALQLRGVSKAWHTLLPSVLVARQVWFALNGSLSSNPLCHWTGDAPPYRTYCIDQFRARLRCFPLVKLTCDTPTDLLSAVQSCSGHEAIVHADVHLVSTSGLEDLKTALSYETIVRLHLVLGPCNLVARGTNASSLILGYEAEPNGLYHFPRRLMPDLAAVLKGTPSLRAIRLSITDHRWLEENSIAIAGILDSNPTLQQFALSGTEFWIYHNGFAVFLQALAKASIQLTHFYLNPDGGCEEGYCSQDWPANFCEWADIFSSDDPFVEERSSVNGLELRSSSQSKPYQAVSETKDKEDNKYEEAEDEEDEKCDEEAEDEEDEQYEEYEEYDQMRENARHKRERTESLGWDTLEMCGHYTSWGDWKYECMEESGLQEKIFNLSCLGKYGITAEQFTTDYRKYDLIKSAAAKVAAKPRLTVKPNPQTPIEGMFMNIDQFG